MVNSKDENKKPSNTIKEGTETILDQQKQQVANTISTISETTNRVNDNINEYQETNRENFDKSIYTANKYQQEPMNTIQLISNNYVELQKNIANTFQSSYSTFLDNISNNKSYWNNFLYSQRYTDVYNKTNQNITDITINCIQKLNDFALMSTETFNKSIEIAQKYYNKSIQNYFNFVNKIGRSYYNQ
jgi:ABC-type transporter Mla subunit MlaD